METIVGLVPDEIHVTEARQEMRSAGFQENKIRVLRKPEDVWNRLKGNKKSRVLFRDVAIGAIVGLALGLLNGATTGYLNCKLMDCPIGSSMIFMTLIVLFCVISGASFGAIVGLDQQDRPLHSYVEGVSRGQALIVVETSTDTAQAVRHILEQHGTIVDAIHENTKWVEEMDLEP